MCGVCALRLRLRCSARFCFLPDLRRRGRFVRLLALEQLARFGERIVRGVVVADHRLRQRDAITIRRRIQRGLIAYFQTARNLSIIGRVS